MALHIFIRKLLKKVFCVSNIHTWVCRCTEGGGQWGTYPPGLRFTYFSLLCEILIGKFYCLIVYLVPSYLHSKFREKTSNNTQVPHTAWANLRRLPLYGPSEPGFLKTGGIAGTVSGPYISLGCAGAGLDRSEQNLTIQAGLSGSKSRTKIEEF